MTAALLIVMIMSILIPAYALYQNHRFERVFRIRIRWMINEDPRLKKYNMIEMHKPSKSNWYGLRLPNEKHFK